MSKNTIEHDMPRQVTPEPEPLVTTDLVTRVKLYEADHELAVKTQEQAQVISRQITIQEVLREAIHVGLPLVAKRYKAAAKAALKASKES